MLQFADKTPKKQANQMPKEQYKDADDEEQPKTRITT